MCCDHDFERRCEGPLRILLKTTIASIVVLLAASISTIAVTPSYAEPFERPTACEKERDIAVSRYLASESERNLKKRYDLALLLAIQANRIETTSESVASLARALEQYKPIHNFLQVPRVWQGQMPSPSAVRFSPDGGFLVAREDPNLVAVWDLQERRIVRRIAIPDGWGQLMALGPRGMFVAILGPGKMGNGKIGIWNTQTNDRVGAVPYRCWEMGRSLEYLAKISPNGSLLATRGPEGIRVWDIDTETEQAFIPADPEGRGLAFGPSSRLIAYDDPKREAIVVWDLHNREEQRTLESPEGRWRSMAFDHSGRYLAVGGLGVIVFDLSNVKPPIALKGLPSASGAGLYTNSVAFHPENSQFVVMSYRGPNVEIRLGSPDSPSCGAPYLSLPGHGYSDPGVTFTPDGNYIVCAGQDGQIVLMDSKPTGKSRSVFLPQVLPHVHAMAFVPDGSGMVVTGRNDKIKVNTAPVGLEIVPDRLLVSRDCRYLAAATIQTIQPDVPQEHRVWRGRRIEPAPGGIFILDRQTGETVSKFSYPHVLFGPDSRYGRLAFDANDNLVALYGISGQKTSRFITCRLAKWNRKANEWTHQRIDELERNWVKITLSPDGRYIAAVNRHRADEVGLRSTSSPETVLRTIRSRLGYVKNLAFSPDGCVLACVSGRRLEGQADPQNWIELWQTDTGKQIEFPRFLTAGESAEITLSPNRKMMALGENRQCEMTLWGLPPRFEIGGRFSIFSGCASYSSDSGASRTMDRLSFSPDGKTLAARVKTKDHKHRDRFDAYLWDMDINSWNSEACRIANRNLSQSEWKRYMGDTPYCRTCPDLPDGPAPDLGMQ